MGIFIPDIIIFCLNVFINLNLVSQVSNVAHGHLVFESAREARRLPAIMCIGFLANHCLCKQLQNQLDRFHQCLFTTFQILFLCT